MYLLKIFLLIYWPIFVININGYLVDINIDLSLKFIGKKFSINSLYNIIKENVLQLKM